MEAKEKAVKILLVIVLLFGMSGISIMIAGEQRASVGSIFGPDNKNETVLRAQTKLKEIGIYDGRLSGLFGTRTQFAVFEFQTLKGLTPNGILDIPTQRELFAREYIEVGYTNDGNTFLAEWIRYILGAEGKKFEGKGKLILAQQSEVFQNISTSLVLESEDGNSYSVKNISSRNLEEFLNKEVSINGFILSDNNNLDLPTVFVNHVEGDGQDFPTSVGYTDEGNQYLQKWVNKIYREEPDLQGLIGVLSAGKKVQYARGGNYTQLVLATSDGSRYSVENISTADLSSLVGNEIMIRGVVLKKLNSLGLKTVVINYILPI